MENDSDDEIPEEYSPGPAENEEIQYNRIYNLDSLGDIQPIATQGTQIDTRNLITQTRGTRSRSDIEKQTFSKFRNVNNNQIPKKENVRCQSIRSLKRLIREVSEGKVPKNKLGEVDKKNPNSYECWITLRDFIMNNFDRLLEASKTEKGPKTDGKSKRKGEASSKSFNDSYCRAFFSDPVTKQAHELFIELIFADLNCKKLTKKFNLTTHLNSSKSCCKCEEAWLSLKSYLKTQMIIDLNSAIVETNT